MADNVFVFLISFVLCCSSVLDTFSFFIIITLLLYNLLLLCFLSFMYIINTARAYLKISYGVEVTNPLK